METQGKNISRVIFHNEPKLSEHEVQSKFNERRIALVPIIKDFVSTHPKLRDKEVGITFAQKGVSSLVCIIETIEEKFILKIRLRTSNNNLDESQFLKVWEKTGVKVPHVFEEGILNGHAYTLMEYIDAPILSDVYKNKELLEKGIYFDLGSILRKMHEPKGEGYGRIIDGKTEFANFEDWIESEDMQKRFQYVNENMLLGEEHGSLSIAIQILIKHVNGENKSSYCHFDFGTSNMFATQPITIFDPNPEFNNPYLDLGRSIVIRIAHDGVFPQQLVDGYFKGEPYNEKALQASILINSYQKFNYWNKTKALKLIKNIQDYLLQNKLSI